MHIRTTSALLAALLGVLGAGSCQASGPPQTYLAVGDSLAYGFMDFTATPVGTAGFPGYAQPYAAYLSTQAGAPVNLIDLGIVGETTDTLLNNTTGNNSLNSNYAAAQSQFELLSQDLNSNVSHVTVQIGANDILGLATSNAFEAAVLSGDTGTEQTLLNNTLVHIASNYNTLLNQISALAPGADVQVLGYYNPYAALPPIDSTNIYLRAVSNPLEQGLNTVIAQEATAHGDQFVDLATPFAGHEDTLVLTNELLPTGFGVIPNDHPTAAGYAVIAQQLEAAPVPEAGTNVGLGLGLSLLVLLAYRRRAGNRA